MKIAFTTMGHNLESPLERRFGRSPRFLVFDSDKDAFEIVENTMNREAVQGAGIQAAERVVRSGAGCLVSGHCGPKAFRVLRAAGLSIYLSDAPTVAAALNLYRTGGLIEASTADVEGHG